MSDWEEFFLAASPALLAPRARFRHNCSLRGGGGGRRRRLLEFRQLVLERGSEKTAAGEKEKEQVKCFLEEEGREKSPIFHTKRYFVLVGNAESG